MMNFMIPFMKLSQKLIIGFQFLLLGQAGDMNINVSSQDAVSQQYKNMILSVGLRNLVANQYTRITDQSETTIDHILTNLPNENISSAGVVQWEVADHLSIYVKAKLSHNQQLKIDPPSYKRFFSESKKETFCNTFCTNLTNADICFSFDSNANDPNLVLEKLTEVIKNSYNEVFPLRKVSKRKMKKQKKPWMNYRILDIEHKLNHFQMRNNKI